ncbi:MAG: radical SAM/SPASM domain-containing protein [Thermodesulfobacteriota bacterium]
MGIFFWKKFWSRQGQKKFGAWQIELTSRCPLQCRMCNHIEYNDFYREDMPFENFKKILPYLKEVETVILEGWGESLLYHHLPECIRLVKNEGSEVGFVTSGQGLNEAYISELLAAGVDFMGFSLAGTTPQTHDAIRINSSLSKLLASIQLLQELKKKRKISHPRLHIVYLILKDNIHEVPDLIGLCQELGISEIIIINLIHVTNIWQDEQKVFGSIVFPEHQRLLTDAALKARQKKIKIHCPSLSFLEVGLCSENPLRNLYISVNGEVSPCVYSNPPLPSPFKRIFKGQEFQIPRKNFGNIFQEHISQIWEAPPYRDFRNGWLARKQLSARAASLLFDPDRYKEQPLAPLPPPPILCQTCYKSLGV